ncbi:geranylgeranyl pyrophosphate synthase-like [Aricia agestis]|uniref:geranylgeranyl pyrophosphate synthase-like n=1 Tax=Aricia agestis TaxID=91739 RepID=UPI001C2098C7|nr:geranylgeranyl pyrophosphate synthase-like [Aricia agestis]
MRTRDIKTKEYLLSLVEEGGGIQMTRELLHQLETEMFREIERLGGNPQMVALIRDLQTWDEREQKTSLTGCYNTNQTSN